MQSRLTEFALVALGHARNMAAPIASPEALVWAQAALLRLPLILSDPAVALAEPQPSTEGLTALSFLVGQRIVDAADDYAGHRVYASRSQPHAVVIQGGPLRQRMIWLEKSRLKVAVTTDSPGAVHEDPLFDDRRGLKLFDVGAFGRSGSSRAHPELTKIVDAKLGFSCTGLPQAVEQLARKFGSRYEGLPEGAEAVIDAVSRVLGESASDEELIIEADLAAARLAAALLFPTKAKDQQAARLWLTGPKLTHHSEITDLGAGAFSEQELAAAEQTPETFALCLAFGPALGFWTTGSDASCYVKAIKSVLCETFALTPAGWKGLVALAIKRPRLVFELRGVALDTYYDNQRVFDKVGYARLLSNGSAPTSGQQVCILEVCMLASLCAAGNIDFELGFDAMFPELNLGERRGPKVSLNQLLPLLSLAPLSWRSLMGAGTATGSGEPWLISSWSDVCKRHGVLGETELSPQGFAKLTLAGWTPSGEQELMMAALERDRYAREIKGPSMVQSLLSRLSAIGISSKSLDLEATSVADFLSQVELGFWELAPHKISWGWIKERARLWHDHVARQEASHNSWAPAEVIGTPEGWFDLGSAWRARELTHGGALLQEGLTMRHCVSLYAERCAAGQCRIFSLQSTDGKTRSTLEFAIQKDQTGAEIGVKLVQHRGFANSEPSLLSKLTAQRVEQRINQHINQRLAEARDSKPTLLVR